MVTNISPDDEFEFSRNTIKNILTAYSKLQQDDQALLRFVRAPDEYMKEALGPEEMGAGLHFHLQHSDIVYPQDTAPPPNQLVFTSELYVAPRLIPDIVELINKSKIEDLARGGGAYCGGCRRCAIARVIGFENPGETEIK